MLDRIHESAKLSRKRLESLNSPLGNSIGALYLTHYKTLDLVIGTAGISIAGLVHECHAILPGRVIIEETSKEDPTHKL